jgi:hypothetical protein
MQKICVEEILVNVHAGVFFVIRSIESKTFHMHINPISHIRISL